MYRVPVVAVVNTKANNSSELDSKSHVLTFGHIEKHHMLFSLLGIVIICLNYSQWSAWNEVCYFETHPLRDSFWAVSVAQLGQWLPSMLKALGLITNTSR